MAAKSQNYLARENDDRVRGGTRMRASDGTVIPGEFNTSTGKPIGQDGRNRPMGLSSDAEWAAKFPTSPTAKRLAGQAPAPAPLITGTVRQDGPSNIKLPTPPPAAGASPEYVAKAVAANPMGAASFMTPWAAGDRSAPAPAMPAPGPQVAPAAPPAITPANPASVGPAISAPTAPKPLWDQVVNGASRMMQPLANATIPSPVAAPPSSSPAAPAATPRPLWDRAAQMATGNPTLGSVFTPEGVGRSLKKTHERLSGLRDSALGAAKWLGTEVVPGAAKSVYRGLRAAGDLPWRVAQGAGLPVPPWVQKPQPQKTATPVSKRPEAQPVY